MEKREYGISVSNHCKNTKNIPITLFSPTMMNFKSNRLSWSNIHSTGAIRRAALSPARTAESVEAVYFMVSDLLNDVPLTDVFGMMAQVKLTNVRRTKDRLHVKGTIPGSP